VIRQIAIRNINATVIEALQRRADACGTSMEQQARRLSQRRSVSTAKQPPGGSAKSAGSSVGSKAFRA
jgi:plasmid stability protein